MHMQSRVLLCKRGSNCGATSERIGPDSSDMCSSWQMMKTATETLGSNFLINKTAFVEILKDGSLL